MSVIATSDDSTKRLPPLMQVTVIDPREKFSTSPRELAIDPVAPLFPGQKKSQSIHESSNRIKQRYKKLSSFVKYRRPSPKLGSILAAFRFRFTISSLIVRHCGIVYGA